MDHRSEIRDFRTTRRAELTPEQAGLPGDRVPVQGETRGD
jgi:hypothetical protein